VFFEESEALKMGDSSDIFADRKTSSKYIIL